MSLNVLRAPRETKDDNDAIVRHTLIFLTMMIGLREITEKNLPEWYARVHTLEKLNGAFMRRAMKRGLKDRPVTVKDLRSWIGLRTNASEMTRAQFMKTVSNRMDEIVRDVERGKVK